MTKETKKVKEPVFAITASQLLKTEKAINDAEKKASTNGNTVQQQYHIIAASALAHLAKNKDIRIIRRMIENFPASLRKNAMLTYLERFGQVRVLIEGDLLKPEYKGLDKGDIVFDKSKTLKLADALSTAWWTAANEPVYKPLDTQAALGQFIAMHERRIKQGVSKEKGDNVDLKLLEKLKALHKAA